MQKLFLFANLFILEWDLSELLILLFKPLKFTFLTELLTMILIFFFHLLISPLDLFYNLSVLFDLSLESVSITLFTLTYLCNILLLYYQLQSFLNMSDIVILINTHSIRASLGTLHVRLGFQSWKFGITFDIFRIPSGG